MSYLHNYADNNFDTRGSGYLRSHVYFITCHVPCPNISLDIVCELKTKYIFLAIALMIKAQSWFYFTKVVYFSVREVSSKQYIEIQFVPHRRHIPPPLQKRPRLMAFIVRTIRNTHIHFCGQNVELYYVKAGGRIKPVLNGISRDQNIFPPEARFPFN
jgi:hypothetical protein